jgi:hypothetical protein
MTDQKGQVDLTGVETGEMTAGAVVAEIAEAVVVVTAGAEITAAVARVEEGRKQMC